MEQNNDPQKPLPVKGVDLSVYKEPLGGIDLGQKPLPKMEASSRDVGLSLDKDTFDEKFPTSYISDNIPQKLAEKQSNWDRTGNVLARMASNIVGGTISSVGSVGAVAEGIHDEVKGQDADFSNSITEFGDSIKEWARTNFPNYRENPGKSWDLADPAWWFEGVESAASTLEFMAGAMGAVKGVGLLSKLLRAEQILAKTGANVGKIKLGAKIATGAIFSRNAENMMESFQLSKNTREQLLQEYSNPEAFEEAKNTQAAKELAATGREVTPENLAKYVAGRAGWEAYRTNSINVVFDAMQMIPLVKGFNPSTRMGSFRTPGKIAAAERQVLDKSAKGVTKLERVYDIANPMVSSLGRSWTEGIEEAINYYGTHKGENLAARLTGKEERDVDLGQMSEAGFWGVFGGMAAEGVGKLVNNKESSSSNAIRLAEIQNRMNILQETSNMIKTIEESKEVPDDQKKTLINQVKAQSEFDMYFRAYQAGNGNGLENMMRSPEYKQKLIDLGIADPIDADKAIAKSLANGKLVEKAYKDYTNELFYKDGSELAKRSLVKNAAMSEYFIKKNEEKIATFNKELQTLKSEDQYFKNSTNPQLESLIYLQALKTAKKGLEQNVNAISTKEHPALSIAGKKELELIDKKIAEYQEQTKDAPSLDLLSLNPGIISKQASIILAERTNSMTGSNIRNNMTQSAVTKEDENIKELDKKQEELKFQALKDTVEKDPNITSTKIEELLPKFKGDVEKTKYLNNKLKEIKDKEAKAEAEAQVKAAQQKTANPVTATSVVNTNNIPVPPVNNEKKIADLQGKKNVFLNVANMVQPDQYGNYNIAVDGEGFAAETLEELKALIEKHFDEQIEAIQLTQANTPVQTSTQPELEFNEEMQQRPEPKAGNVIGHSVYDKDPSVQVDVKKRELEEPKPVRNYIRLAIPIFQYQLQNFNGLKYKNVAENKDKSIYLKGKENSDIIRTLMNPEFKEGSEIEISWDKSNSYTKEEQKGNINEEAFKITYNGVLLGYMPTVSSTKAEIKRRKDKGEEYADLEIELAMTEKLRSTLSLEEGVIYKTTLVKKGNGTVLSNGLSPEVRHSVKGIYEEFYALDPTDPREYMTLINLRDHKETFSSIHGLYYIIDGVIIPKHGKIYGKQVDARGVPFPVPLFVSTVTSAQATVIQQHIIELMELLKAGKNNKDEEVQRVKDEIAKYIAVDRKANFNDKVYSFQVYPKGKNKDGEETEARIVLAFNKGDKRHTIVIKDGWVGEFNEKGEIIQHPTVPVINGRLIKEALQGKSQNVDFKLLKENKPFKFGNKTYPSYREYLIEEEVIQTDIAQVKDNEGKPITNLYGSDNDFTIGIADVVTKKESVTNNAKIAELEAKRKEEIDALHKPEVFEESKSGITIEDFLKQEGLTEDFAFILPRLTEYKLKVVYSKTEEDPALANIRKVDKKTGKTVSNKLELRLPKNFHKLKPELKKEIVAHEIVHGLLRTNIKKEDEAKFIEELDQLVEDFETELRSDFDGYLKKAGISDDNIDDILAIFEYIGSKENGSEEYITYGLTHPLFIKLLKVVEADKTTKETFWDKFVRIITEFFGIENNQFNTLIDFLEKSNIRFETTEQTIKKINEKYDAEIAKYQPKPKPKKRTVTIADKALALEVTKPEELAMQFLIEGNTLNLEGLFKGSKKENSIRNYVSDKGLTLDDAADRLWERNRELKYESSDYKNALESVVREYSNTNRHGKNGLGMAESLMEIYLENKENDERAEMNAYLASQMREQFDNESVLAVAEPTVKVEDVKYRELGNSKVDKFGNNFSREEILEEVNVLEGMIANLYLNRRLDLGDQFIDLTDESKIKDELKYEYFQYKKGVTGEYKHGANITFAYFDELYEEATKRLEKYFRSTELNQELNDEYEVEKSWNDKGEQQNSSESGVPTKIKMFMKTIPLLKSLNTRIENGEIVWDREVSSVTGRGKYIDFTTVYPYLIRNMIGARSQHEIIKRLNNMAKTQPSFAYIAYQLNNNAQLLAQFESALAKKFVYDSYVTFIRNLGDHKEIYIQSELKNTRQDSIIWKDYMKSVNEVITKFNNKEDITYRTDLDYKIAGINGYENQIKKLAENFKDNIPAISQLVKDYAKDIGIDISYAVITSELEGISEFSNFNLYKDIKNIYNIIITNEKRKPDDFKSYAGNIANKEAVIRVDIVENGGIDIKGNPIFAIRNPNFISEWFSSAHSTTEEGANLEFTTYLHNVAKVPSMQFSNILWNSPENGLNGMLNFEVKDGIKVPTTVNWEFVRAFKFHNFGGAKELLTKEAQDYTDMVDNDWNLINIINYINPRELSEANTKKEDWIFLPSIIPSDSSSMFNYEVKKIKLGKNDLIKTGKKNKLKLSINPDSKLFNAAYKVAYQEVRKMQQATELLFDIVDGELKVKEGLNFNTLQQHYHFGKSISYNSDGTVNVEKTLLKDGKPTGGVFKFVYLNYESNGKLVTLNDKGLKTHGVLTIGDLGKHKNNVIKAHVQDFLDNLINEAYIDYLPIKSDINGKYDNIADGTFEGLIAEYTLNAFIFNTEQFNLFNGDITEYKTIIETNKRAKQMYAPGIKLSLEAMKIKYENGNWSDGRTFRGVTIKDVNLPAKDMQTIVNRIKEALITQKTYDKTSVKLENILGEPTNKLEKDIQDVVAPYFNINAGDAQGYSTLDRREQILRGRGSFEGKEEIFDKARRGTLENNLATPSLQPLKGYYYGREYDSAINRLRSNQIKYSSLTLTPQLVAGTELEKLLNWMNKNNIDEVFFESAHKVGAGNIYKIHNEDGTINESVLEKIEPTIFFNKNYEVQLDVPEHIVDTKNLMATQIAKLIISNINPNTEYTVGNKIYKGSDLIDHYFNILNSNIEESADDLLKLLNIGVQRDSSGKVINYLIKDKDIQKVLEEEIKTRGLSDNYNYAIELDEDGSFKLPLFINSMSTKWESILTSLFTNNIIKQKLPGGSAVLGSRIFMDSAIEQKDSNIQGIQWSADKGADRTLRSYTTMEDGKEVRTIEVLMSSWSSELFNDRNRIHIDNIPEEVRTMIGYRIPTTSKAYMVVFKVVGLLPEQNRGLVVTPDDMVVQMGQDFDIDKWFIMNKHFYVNTHGRFVVPRLDTEETEYNALKAEADSLKADLNLIDEDSEDFGLASEETKVKIKKIRKRIKELMYKDENGKYQFKQSPSRQAKENEIFDIYKAILTNSAHSGEISTPSGYPLLTSLKNEVKEVYHENDDSLNPATDKAQRLLRKRNIAGKSLTAIAANMNAFGAIAQYTKMKLSNPYKFKISLDEVSNDELQKLMEKYGDDLQVNNDDNTATISFKNLGSAPDGSYTNVEGKLILDTASEGVVTAVDNAKDPVLDTLNLTVYTYPTYHVGVLAGVPVRTMGMFIRQPVVKALNDYYFENLSLLGKAKGNHVERVKRYYQTILYKELVDNKMAPADQKLQKVLDKRATTNIADKYDKKYLIFLQREDTAKFLGYNPDESVAFSAEELKEQLEFHSDFNTNKNWTKLPIEKKVKFLRNQLQILEQFISLEKDSKVVNTLIQTTKTDSLGAGPSMDVTTNLIRKINKLRKNLTVTINGKPAVTQIYPIHFNELDPNEFPIVGKSAYPPLQHYLELGNKLSVEVLKNLFITQNQSFKNVISTIVGMRKGTALEEREIGAVNRYLNASLLESFDHFRGLDRERVLGIDTPILEDTTDINKFKELSTANKVAILQRRNEQELQKNKQHVLNFLTPNLKDVEKNGYHKLDILTYKNEFTDDNLADSIYKMYEKGNEFEKNLAIDLINYSYVSSGLSFGLQSFAKVIPNRLLHELGLGTYLKEIKDLPFDFGNKADLFYRNNWNNNSLVPKATTQWETVSEDVIEEVREEISAKYKNKMIDYISMSTKYGISPEAIDEINKGKKYIIKENAEGEKSTRDWTPEWEATASILRIENTKLKNSPEDVMNAPYITIYDKGSKSLNLFKRYEVVENTDNKEVKRKTVFDGNVWYYRVNKLGKDGIPEFTEESIFPVNNSGLNEKELEKQIESNIFKTSQQKVTKDLTVTTTTKEEQEEQNNHCKIKRKS